MLTVGLPLILRIVGRPYPVRAADTAELLEILARDSWIELIPGLIEPARDELEERFNDRDDPVDWVHMWRAAHILVKALTSLEWAPAVRLANAILGAPFMFEAWSVRRGFSPAREPIGRVLAGAYMWLCEQQESADELRTLDGRIWRPDGRMMVLGVAPWSAESEALNWRTATEAISAEQA